MKGLSKRICNVSLLHSVWCSAELSSVGETGDVVWKSVWSVWSTLLPAAGQRVVGSKEEAELLCASLGLSVDWVSPVAKGSHVVFPAKEGV